MNDKFRSLVNRHHEAFKRLFELNPEPYKNVDKRIASDVTSKHAPKKKK